MGTYVVEKQGIITLHQKMYLYNNKDQIKKAHHFFAYKAFS